MLGRVPWRMEDFDRDVAEFEDVAVADAAEGWGRFGAGEQHVLGADSFGQSPPCRHMIGVNMRVDDVENANPGVLGRVDIRGDLAHGIDDGGRRLSTAAEEVGDRDGIGAQELSQDHGGLRFLRASDRYAALRSDSSWLDKFGRASFNNYVE